MPLRCSLRWLTPLLVVISVGCSSSDAEPTRPRPDEIEYEIFPTTTILSPSELSGLSARPDGTLSFATAPASLAAVAVGNVIVAGVSSTTPAGLLRVVTQVQRTGRALELGTVQAPLALAFRKLHVRSERDVTGFGSARWTSSDMSTRSLRPQAELIGGDIDAEQPLDFLLFDADDDPSTESDQIGIRGAIGGGFHYGISVDVDWGDVFDLPNAVKSCVESLARIVVGSLPDCSLTALLPEVKVGFSADPFMKAHASLYGAASLSYEKDFDVASIPLSPIPIGPLVFVPSVDITANVSGSAGAGFTVGAHGAVELESSVTISSKHLESPDVVPFRVRRVDFEADETKVILQASAKVGLGARLNVQLYGIVGPYAQATAFAAVQANAASTPCWALHIGVDTALGVRVTSPTIPFLGSITLLDWKGAEFSPLDEVVASGACLPVEKGPALPPGSGPDAVSYANPDFVPWVRVRSAVGDDGAVKSFLDDGREWTDNALAIDGRYVTVGSRNDVAVKFDESGGLLWSRRYRRQAGSPALILRRAVPTHDAGILLLVQAQDSEGPSLLKVGQAGGVWWRKRVEPSPDAACDFQPLGLIPDAGRGFFVLATCLGDERAALAHLDEEADVISLHVFGDVDPRQRSIAPTAFARVGNDVVVAGSSSTTAEGARMFALRLNDSGAASWANRFVGCSEAPDLNPSQAHVNASGQLTVVGTAADHRAGLVMRIKDDGSVAFANFPRFDTSGSQPFNVHAFAELPTTGLLVAGSTTHLGLPSGSPGTETSLFLASLDATGRALWAQRYSLPNLRSVNHASVRLTNDGGALVTGIAQHTAQPGGSLYAMKAFAKDGALGGAPGVGVASLAVVEPLACAVRALPWSTRLRATGAVSREVATVAEDAGVQTE